MIFCVRQTAAKERPGTSSAVLGMLFEADDLRELCDLETIQHVFKDELERLGKLHQMQSFEVGPTDPVTQPDSWWFSFMLSP